MSMKKYEDRERFCQVFTSSTKHFYFIKDFIKSLKNTKEQPSFFCFKCEYLRSLSRIRPRNTKYKTKLSKASSPNSVFYLKRI